MEKVVLATPHAQQLSQEVQEAPLDPDMLGEHQPCLITSGVMFCEGFNEDGLSSFGL